MNFLSRLSAWALLFCFVMITSSLFFAQYSVRAAPTIAPGFDLFQTDSLNTQFSFQDEFTLPPGFFGPGSDPFTGIVPFGGVPIGWSGLNYTGTTDTIVQRLQAADLSSGMATIPIQLVSLSLVSVNPITVTYHGGMNPSFFDVFVEVSPSVPSNGTMTISSGGTFDSALTVYPFLTFIRENDTLQRQLDLGNFLPVLCPGTLLKQCVSDLTLKATGTPWATPPCPSDDFIVTGLNDQFCAGSNPTQPTRLIEQSRLEKHAVVPVQGPHWKCYSIVTPTNQAPLNKASNLRDQFENETVTIGVSQLLCNPVSKLLVSGVRQVQFSPPLEPHLKCYTVNPSGDPKKLANVTTQFGTDRNLDIDGSKWICVQAAKRIATNLPVNRFPIPLAPVLQKQPDVKCYSTDNTGKAPNAGAILWDEFHNETVDITAPSYFCAPVTKSFQTGGIPVLPLLAPHILCYNITGPSLNVQVNLRDGFENETGVIVTTPTFLCAYAVKSGVTDEPIVGRQPLTPETILIAVSSIIVAFAVLVRRGKRTALRFTGPKVRGKNLQIN